MLGNTLSTISRNNSWVIFINSAISHGTARFQEWEAETFWTQDCIDKILNLQTSSAGELGTTRTTLSDDNRDNRNF